MGVGPHEKVMNAVTDPAIALLRNLVAINSVNPTLVPGAPGRGATFGARFPRVPSGERHG